MVLTATCKKCGARLHFLGLPSAHLRDTPAGEDTEDDGIDTTKIYLPGIWK